MNEQTAYNIAAAVEKKLGQMICLRSTLDVWEWGNGDKYYAVLKNTPCPPLPIAQNICVLLKQPTIKINKRKKDEDE